MEKGKITATELTSSLDGLKLNTTPKRSNSSSLSSNSLDLPVRRTRPRRLVSLCLGVIGQHLEDIISDLTEIAAGFPPDIKLAMLAIARRRKLLNDEVLISLADNSWELLDISGSDVTDVGLARAAESCTRLRAVDISRCAMVTATGVSEVLCHCRSLEVLRCGGSPKSNSTARNCLNLLKPKLNNVEEDSWEELDSVEIGNAPQSLCWLVWLNIDEDSKMTLAAECPRIVVNPQPSSIGPRRLQIPSEALASSALDQPILEDIDPKTWAVSGAARRPPVLVPRSPDVPVLHMAEKFRLAFAERDTRLAPKRAKNARQHRRREEREWMMSSTEAKSVALASKASRFLHHRS